MFQIAYDHHIWQRLLSLFCRCFLEKGSGGVRGGGQAGHRTGGRVVHGKETASRLVTPSQYEGKEINSEPTQRAAQVHNLSSGDN